MRITPNRRIAVSILVLIATCGSAGCGMTARQRSAVRQFSDATAQLADLAGEHLTDSRRQVVAMGLLRAKLGDATASVGLGTTDTNDNGTAELIAPRHLHDRLTALAALRDYANLLGTLSGGSAADDTQVAATALHASLARAGWVGTDNPRSRLFGQLVMLSAGQVSEAQRAEALRRVVVDAEPFVLHVLTLLQDDLDARAEQWAFAYMASIDLLTQAATLAESRLRAGDDPSNAVMRASIVEARLVASHNAEAFTRTSLELRQLIVAVRLGQVNLRTALQSPDVTIEDIERLMLNARDAVQAIAAIRAER